MWTVYRKNVNFQLFVDKMETSGNIGICFLYDKNRLELSGGCPSQSSFVSRCPLQAQLTHLGSLLDLIGNRVCSVWQKNSGTSYKKLGERYKARGIQMG